MNGEGSVGKKRGHRGAPKGHRGGSVEEAHTLICHVLVCVGAQKSALQSPVETQATVWFTAAARVCVAISEGRKESHHIGCKAHCSVGLQNRPQCQYDSII